MGEVYSSRDHEHSTSSALDWLRSDRLLYTLAQEGWRKGEPVMVNQFMVRIDWDSRHATAEDGERLIQAILAAISSAERVAGDSSRDTQNPPPPLLARGV